MNNLPLFAIVLSLYLPNNITHHKHIPSTTNQTNQTTTIKMSLPFTVLPCRTCDRFECANKWHDSPRPVMVTLSRAPGQNPTVNGIFCHPGSRWNTAYPLDEPLTRSEIILHAAVIAIRQVAAYLANQSAGRTAIKEIFLKINIKKFILWYESKDRDSGVKPRCAALLRDLDDAAVLVGECGGCRLVVRFFKPPYPHRGSFHYGKHSQQAAGDLAVRVLHHHLSGKLHVKCLLSDSYSC
jgi:hypothetical protein